MKLSEVKTNLNAVVIYNDTAYIFKGCTIRKDTKTNEIFYQAELADMKARSVLTVKLSDIQISQKGRFQ